MEISSSLEHSLKDILKEDQVYAGDLWHCVWMCHFVPVTEMECRGKQDIERKVLNVKILKLNSLFLLWIKQPMENRV